MCKQSPFEFLIMFDVLGKMPIKILMCPCNKDYFMQTNVPVIKHLCHFHCKCEEKVHEMFVHCCSCHPFGTTIFNIVNTHGTVENRCFCKKKQLMNFVVIVSLFDIV